MSALQNGLTNQILRVHDFLGFLQDLRSDLLGDYQCPILVTDDEVPATDRHASDSDRIPNRNHFPTSQDVARCSIAAEDGKTEFEDVIHVASAAINYGPSGATILGGLSRKFADMRADTVVRLTND